MIKNTISVKKIILLVFVHIVHINYCMSQVILRDSSINIYFATNSYEIDSIQLKVLQGFSSDFTIQSIIGYTDTIGTRFYNNILSQKRAVAVIHALNKDLEIFNKRIIINKGESIVERVLWKNRRVQIIASRIPVDEPKSHSPVKNTVDVKTFTLEYVYFIPDQAIITQESVDYIHELAEILKTYKTETFEIVGHINYQSRFDSSHLTDIFKLSERRAKAVFDYLVEFGIPANRMKYKGVGNSNPVYPSPKNDEEKRKNMRVQIIVKE